MQEQELWTVNSQTEIKESYIESFFNVNIEDNLSERSIRRNSFLNYESSSTDSLLDLSIDENEIIYLEDDVISWPITVDDVCDNYSKTIKGRVAKTIQSVGGCNYLTKLLDDFSENVIYKIYEEIKDQICFLEKHIIASKFILRLDDILKRMMM